MMKHCLIRLYFASLGLIVHSGFQFAAITNWNNNDEIFERSNSNLLPGVGFWVDITPKLV